MTINPKYSCGSSRSERVFPMGEVEVRALVDFSLDIYVGELLVLRRAQWLRKNDGAEHHWRPG